MDDNPTESTLKFKYFDLFTISGSIISTVLSIGLIINLTHKKSNYSRIMRHILMSECIFVFAEMYSVSAGEYFHSLICQIFMFFTFNFSNQEMDCKELKYSNVSAYYGNQAFSVVLNIFICLEVILILKNPISQLKSRLKPYFLISTLTGLTVFFSTVFTANKKISSKEIPLSDLFYKIPICINLFIFLIFLIISIISMIYLFVRFCIGKPLVQNLKNFFVIRHFIYVTLYIICMIPNKINEVIFLFSERDSNNFLYLEYGIILNTFMGFFMFLIRVTETNFYSKLFCYSEPIEENLDLTKEGSNLTSDLIREKSNAAFFDKDLPLTAIISRNMNMEFMCCILFGLTEIFMKPERKNKTSFENLQAQENQDKTVTFDISKSNLKNLEYTNNNITNITVNQTQINNTFNQQLNSRSISGKDYHRAKSHKIRYNKIFNSNVDLDKLEVEVTTDKSVRNPKIRRNSTQSSNYESESNNLKENLVVGGKSKGDHDAIVIEYCPRIFRELRKLDDITGYELERALNPALNKDNINKIRESEGKSGSFFFFSHDNKFIIKTITDNELNTMLGDFIKNYYEHCSSNPESLLARIYGLYSIVIKGVSKINIILMQNLITINKSLIKRIFDLKGSRVERITKNIEKCDNMRALKDLDYLWMIKIEEHMVDFTKDHCDELYNVLSNDLKMLREIEVMDYSLLLIIIHFPKKTDPDFDTIISLMNDNRYCSRIFKSKDMKYIYILGIIDYLQKFNVAKFFENKYKSILYGNEIKYVSAVDPMIYSDRMLNFAKDYIFISSA